MEVKDIALRIRKVEESKNQRKPRWSRLRSYYYNESSEAANEFTGASDVHYNLVQPKVDTLNANVQEVITAETPYCEAKMYGTPESADILERCVQTLLDMSEFPMVLGQCLTNAGLYNLGVMYLGVRDAKVVDNEESEGRVLEMPYMAKPRCIEPEDMVVYPVKATTLSDAEIVGHYFWLSRKEIERRQDEEGWAKGEVHVSGEDEPDGWEEIPEYGKPLRHNAADDKDLRVKLFWGFYRKGNKWVRCVIDPVNEIKYFTEDWVLPFVPYAIFRYKWPATENGIYGCESPAQDIQQPQITLNRLNNQLLDAVDAQTYGATFTDAYLAPDKATEYGFGEVMSIPGANVLQTHFPATNIEAILGVIQFYESKTDGILKIPQISQGQADPDADTATEVRQIAAGGRTGINAYLGTVSMGLAEAFAYYAQRFALDIDQWGNDYADMIGIEDFEEYGVLKNPAVWKVRVKSIGTTPEAAYAAIQQAMAMAENPQSGINIYELVKRGLQTLEKMSGVSLEDIQTAPAQGLLGGGMGQMVPPGADAGVLGGVNADPGGLPPAPGGLPFGQG